MKFASLSTLLFALIMPFHSISAEAEATTNSPNGKGNAPLALGISFFKGDGVPKDDGMAARYFRMSADQGNVDAQNLLGILYKFGQGIPKDSHEAVRWFRIAAGSGHADAQNNLGTMYFSGQGVSQDFRDAVKWFRLAADQGNADARNNLAVAFDEGKGVPSNRVIAYALFNVASASKTSNDDSVILGRKLVANKMSGAEISEAQILTREMSKPNRFILALDEYIKKSKVK